MVRSSSLSLRLATLGRFGTALAGKPVRKWSPRPPLPEGRGPVSWHLAPGLVLWRLPVGFVRVRRRHRELEPELAQADDSFRFPLMMADRGMTGWLDCTAWLIEHEEGLYLVDTGEGTGFDDPGYFDGLARATRWIYPRIIDATGPSGGSLSETLASAGHRLANVSTVVLTHLHSDHIGHVRQLPPTAAIVVDERETLATRGSGRLPQKLPRTGQVRFAVPDAQHPLFGPVHRLTKRGDILFVPLPGHTIGHGGVLIERSGLPAVLLAGDAAFDADQVRRSAVPGIVESLHMHLATLDLLRRFQASGGVCLFSHAAVDATAPFRPHALTPAPASAGPATPAP